MSPIKIDMSFLRFLIVGSTNTLIDLSLFALFANVFDIYPVAANVLSTALTICISFPLNRSFVFKSQRKKRHTAAQFLTITLFSALIVQSLIIYLTIHLLDSSTLFVHNTELLNMLAKVMGIAVSMFVNYFGYRYIFHQKRDGTVDS